MRSSLVSLVLLLCPFSFAGNAPASSPNAPRIPLVFEPNAGQTAPQVRYMARSREGSVFFTNQAVTLATSAGAVRLTFAGARAQAEPTAEDLLPSRSNYLATDSKHSVIGVANYGAVRFQNLYPGIDVRFYGNNQHLEHDISVAPGADPNQFALQLEGAASLHVTPAGTVEFKIGSVAMQESAPVAWQMKAGRKVPVVARWQIEAGNILRISVGDYDKARSLVIDPVLAYSTLLGGTTGSDPSLGTTFPASTAIYSVAVDGSRNMYVAGTTSATDFPTTSGAYDRNVNYLGTYHADTTSQTGFVTKFNKSGQLVYSTFLHWSIFYIAVDSSGAVYTAKYADDGFHGPSEGNDSGVTVDKLSADGSKLLYSYTYGRTPSTTSSQCYAYGDSGVSGLKADNSGHVWIAGSTANPCLITSATAYQKTSLAGESGYIAEFDTTKTGDASIVAATYLSGTKDDEIAALTVDTYGNVYVTGRADSPDFPHTVVYGADTSGTAFVTKLNPTLSALDFSVLVNGVSYNTSNGQVSAIAIDPAFDVYIAGMTAAAGYPTTASAYRKTPAGIDGFVTELNPSGTGLVYSTFLGGSSTDEIWGLAVNSSHLAFVTGSTQSSDFPVTSSAFQKTLAAGATNAFVTAINSGGSSLYYSSFLGGSKNTTADAITLDSAWNAYVVGYTSDANFPVTANAYQKTLKGETDGFLSKVVIAGDLKATMTDNKTSVSRYGYVTFYARVYNAGPDASNNVVFKDPIPSGWSYAGLSTTTADSCTAPAHGATSGSVVCKKSRLEKGQTLYVNVYLRAIAPSGSNIKNAISASAQTQDLNQSNNQATLTVHVN